MIDEKKLAELREFNNTMHSESDWLNFFHGNVQQMIDTLESLRKENAELKEKRDMYLKTIEEENERRFKLEAVARAAEAVDDWESHQCIGDCELCELRKALAALKENP